MKKQVLPKYLGVVAFGVKMGVILPGDDIVQTVYKSIEKCFRDALIEDGDIICVSESVVARSQSNYVTINDIAQEVQLKLGVSQSDHLGVVFPIVSRNRFAGILRGIAKAVSKGRVTVQLSYPTDEVGNQTISEEYLLESGKGVDEKINFTDLAGKRFLHPITGVDYISLYRNIISEVGSREEIFLCNDPLAIVDHKPDGVIIANIHDREKMRVLVRKVFSNCVTLQDICSNKSRSSWSEWGLFGSNLSSRGSIKLAPKEGDKVAVRIQRAIAEGIGKKVEVIISGDGAYKDPSSGIFELADPQTHFGLTEGLMNRMRTGVKYKWLADTLLSQGKNRSEIGREIEVKKQEMQKKESMLMQGTTPRKLADVVSSLADLVSGSADAGTPVVIVKSMMSSR
jgi:F420-0:gamma-glutamyl ligase